MGATAAHFTTRSPYSLFPGPDSLPLKIHMHSNRRHIQRPAVAIVPRIINKRSASRYKHPPPYVSVVIPLHDVLAPVVQSAIAQQKPQPPVMQIILVVTLDR